MIYFYITSDLRIHEKEYTESKKDKQRKHFKNFFTNREKAEVYRQRIRETLDNNKKYKNIMENVRKKRKNKKKSWRQRKFLEKSPEI